jgi:shikimate kinase
MLALPGAVIGGLPAGVVLDASGRARIIASPSHVVWLRATPAVLGRRIGTSSLRPFLGADPLSVLRRMAAERQALYAEVADQVIDVDTLPASAVASLIVEALPVVV